ncbi:hypothetical protein PFISCL1PPCAC_13480, partial [Pristionchus fissidentatus]
LFNTLSRAQSRASVRIYQIPITVSALQGLLLCFFVAIHNFVDIFHDESFISVSIGPLISYLPRPVQEGTFLIAVFLLPMMWVLIPATSV